MLKSRKKFGGVKKSYYLCIIKFKKTNNMKYIIILERLGLCDFLQMRGVTSWFFADNHIKVFKSPKTAIKNANMLLAKKGNCGKVHIIQLDGTDDYITSSSIVRYFDTDKEIYTREFIERRIRHDLSHEELLCIYEHKDGLLGELRDSYDNVINTRLFSKEDSIEYIKEFFGFTNNNSYSY